MWILVATLGAAGCHEHGHGHDHGDPDKAAASLTLDDGKKWQTDAALRAGMTAIRDQMQAAMKPIHEKSYSAEDYRRLAAGIDKEIAGILANCKLPAKADGQFHLVLVQLDAGTALMKTDGDRMAGAAKVVQGLESYGKFFDHPEWKPIEH